METNASARSDRWTRSTPAEYVGVVLRQAAGPLRWGDGPKEGLCAGVGATFR